MVLSLYTGAFYAEIVRGGVNSIEQGQWDAARSLGLHYVQMMRLVILPQAFRRMIPPFMNQSIIQLKNTSLVSTIAVADLLYEGQMITAATYRPLEVYTMVAVLYFAVLFPLTLAAQQVERRLARTEVRSVRNGLPCSAGGSFGVVVRLENRHPPFDLNGPCAAPGGRHA